VYICNAYVYRAAREKSAFDFRRRIPFRKPNATRRALSIDSPVLFRRIGFFSDDHKNTAFTSNPVRVSDGRVTGGGHVRERRKYVFRGHRGRTRDFVFTVVEGTFGKYVECIIIIRTLHTLLCCYTEGNVRRDDHLPGGDWAQPHVFSGIAAGTRRVLFLNADRRPSARINTRRSRRRVATGGTR